MGDIYFGLLRLILADVKFSDCKSAIHRFDSDRRLQKIALKRNGFRAFPLPLWMRLSKVQTSEAADPAIGAGNEVGKVWPWSKMITWSSIAEVIPGAYIDSSFLFPPSP